MSRDVYFKTSIAHAIGKNAAIFLNQCVFWQKTDYVNNRKDNPERNGWFYKSRDEWYSETLLSRYQQEKARKQLRDMGLLTEDHVRLNTGIRIWFRLNLSAYYAMINTAPEKTITEQCRLNLEYDNLDWHFAFQGLFKRACELYPYASQELIADTIDGHLEYWMNRCDGDQAPSMAQLRGMLLTREKDFFEYLNRIGRRDMLGDFSVEPNNSVLSKQSEINESDCMVNELTLTDSRCIDNNETTVPEIGIKDSFMPENGTLVLDNNDIHNDEYSNNYCIDNDDIEVIDSVEADASPLSSDLTECSESYRTDPKTYVYCHPFIHQFVSHLNMIDRDNILPLLKQYGFSHQTVLDALVDFVEIYGNGLQLYWQENHSPVEPLTFDDIEIAINVSIGDHQ